MRIAIDLDDTISDLLGAWVRTVNVWHNENVTVEDIKSWDISNYFKCGIKVYDYLTPDLFSGLKIKPHAREVIRELNEKFEVYIVSAATSYPETIPAKVEWIKRHFSFIPIDNIVFCGSKEIIKADYMIDDGVHNLREFDGKGILFDAPHNRDAKDFYRVKCWKEVREYFGGVK